MLKSKTFRRWTGVLALSGATAGLAAGCAPSVQEEVQMGRQYAAEINRQLPIVQDAAIHRYINELGGQIAAVADQRGIQYTFYVVNSDVVNAFAVPGGFIYINRGLIDRAENMSELAGVLGHEVAHVVARHGVDQMVRMQRAELGVVLGAPQPRGGARGGRPGCAVPAPRGDQPGRHRHLLREAAGGAAASAERGGAVVLDAPADAGAGG
jgi:predicted Zn-dependent protease